MEIRHPILFFCARRKARRAREAEQEARLANARKQIAELQRRKTEVEGYLLPRQRRNHWQESIADMISGRP